MEDKNEEESKTIISRATHEAKRRAGEAAKLAEEEKAAVLAKAEKEAEESKGKGARKNEKGNRR